MTFHYIIFGSFFSFVVFINKVMVKCFVMTIKCKSTIIFLKHLIELTCALYTYINYTNAYLVKSQSVVVREVSLILNKLKPSFPIIKDNKTKGRAGVRDKPLPPNFGR